MADDYIEKALDQALKEFSETVIQHDALEKQVAEASRKAFRQMAKIMSLAALCGDFPPDSAVGTIIRKFQSGGLTDAVRKVMYNLDGWVTTAQIRDQMIRLRVDLTKYRNPLGSIHTILGRLVDDHVIERKIDEKTKKPVFRWKEKEFALAKVSLSPDQIAEVMKQSRKKLAAAAGKRGKVKKD